MIIASGGLPGGEGGIRTHGEVSPTHAFQACSFSHSDTSPRETAPGPSAPKRPDDSPPSGEASTNAAAPRGDGVRPPRCRGKIPKSDPGRGRPRCPQPGRDANP